MVVSEFCLASRSRWVQSAFSSKACFRPAIQEGWGEAVVQAKVPGAVGTGSPKTIVPSGGAWQCLEVFWSSPLEQDMSLEVSGAKVQPQPPTVHRAFIHAMGADCVTPEELWSTSLLESGMNWVSI